MRIDQSHELIAPLAQAWQVTLPHESSELAERASQNFQRRLVNEVFDPIITRFPGELILTYHKFLTMVPSGVHSFTHGSEMISKTVYWVTVGQIALAPVEIIETKEKRHSWDIGGVSPITLVTPPTFLVPVTKKLSLFPRYRMEHHNPYFVVEHPEHEERKRYVLPPDPVNDILLNISQFGQDLFQYGRSGRLDWATKNLLVVGNRSVKLWLESHGSSAAYDELVCQFL